MNERKEADTTLKTASNHGISDTLRKLEAGRNALLAALKAAEPLLEHTCTATSNIHDCARCIAIQAIYKAEGE